MIGDGSTTEFNLIETAERLWCCSSINSRVLLNRSCLNSCSVATSTSWRRRWWSANNVANVRPVSNAFFVPFYHLRSTKCFWFISNIQHDSFDVITSLAGQSISTKSWRSWQVVPIFIGCLNLTMAMCRCTSDGISPLKKNISGITGFNQTSARPM